ncbi:MAG: hypothetical protein GXP17_10020 [Gammaproteobacteria bacterium]|nr:hypothetical protein [Gammaproteobacteria bacterium]
MNPLKLHLPTPSKQDPAQHIPTTGEIATWLGTLDLDDSPNSYSQILGLLQRYNRLLLPAAERFHTIRLLQPAIISLLQPLQEQVRNKPLPLSTKQQSLAEQVHLLLEEMSFAFKLVVNDAICLADDVTGHLSHNDFLLALRQAIVQLGLLLLERYAMYAPAPPGLWGELHRLYHFAERNGLHTMTLEADADSADPLTTVKHTYLRVVLLALAEPNHLGQGQAERVYRYLESWTADCRLLNRKETAVNIGDIMVDLADDRAPVVAAGYTRFRPVEGRFLDISPLQQRLHEATLCSNTETEQTSPSLALVERIHQDFLDQLMTAWAGRSERGHERSPNHQDRVLVCVGLGAIHHFMDDEQDFHPEHREIYFYQPCGHKTGNLELMSRTEASSLHTQDQPGFDSTRLSRFEAKVDVWDPLHDTEIRARALRESTMSDFVVEPWEINNVSKNGLGLRRHPDNRVRLRVGALVAIRAPEPGSDWRIGEIRWLHAPLHDTSDPHGEPVLDIGIKTLSENTNTVAVRAIGGPGSGSEYFRSLLIGADASNFDERVLVVPASVYGVGTQLVLNLKTTIKYVRLTRVVETTSTFSLFAFADIEQPREEQKKIAAMELNSLH